jgi:uncharacterized membrane protein
MKDAPAAGNSWFLWALLSAFFAGVTAILAKVGATGVNPNLATAIRTTVMLVFTWGIAFAISKPAASCPDNTKSAGRTCLKGQIFGWATLSGAGDIPRTEFG